MNLPPAPPVPPTLQSVLSAEEVFDLIGALSIQLEKLLHAEQQQVELLRAIAASLQGQSPK